MLPFTARKTARAPNRRLVSECEAFLCGRSALELAHSGQPVPAWAWANILAHGRLGDIDRFALRRWPRGTPEELVGELAGRVVAYVRRSGTTLWSLRRTTLVPPESHLYEVFGASAPRDRYQLQDWLRSVGGDLLVSLN